MENWANQVGSLNEQLREVKAINENMRQNHKNEMNKVINKYETEIKKLKHDLEITKKKLEDF